MSTAGQGRIIGWKNGKGLTAADVHRECTQNRSDKDYVHKVRKALKRGHEAKTKDPLKDLPPQWKAFWSTVPHMDPKNLYKEYMVQQSKKAENQAALDVFYLEEPGDTDETVKAEITKLQNQREEKKKALQNKAKVVKHWEKKIERLTAKKNEKKEFVQFKANLQYWYREHSIWDARRKSLDSFYGQLTTLYKTRDTSDHQVLVRTQAQLDSDIHEIREEVAGLAEELQKLQETAAAIEPGIED